jgi:DNA-binding MarR family transcriptional regulator
VNVEKIIKTKKSIPISTRTVIHLLLVHNKIAKETVQALKPFDVSPEQFNVLRILQGQGREPANLTTLNERMVKKKSNTTRLVDKLLAKGYVSRDECAVNRRKIEIRITAEGREALRGMSKAVADVESTLLKNFSNVQLEQLNTLLDKF